MIASASSSVVTLSVYHAGKVKQSQIIRNPLVWFSRCQDRNLVAVIGISGEFANIILNESLPVFPAAKILAEELFEVEPMSENGLWAYRHAFFDIAEPVPFLVAIFPPLATASAQPGEPGNAQVREHLIRASWFSPEHRQIAGLQKIGIQSPCAKYLAKFLVCFMSVALLALNARESITTPAPRTTFLRSACLC